MNLRVGAALLACSWVAALPAGCARSRVQEEGNRNAGAEADQSAPQGRLLRAQIGDDSKKIKVAEGKTLLWAGPGKAKEPEWFDLTGAPLAPGKFQFGIGKDTIRAIDDPVFVEPGHPLLVSNGINDSTEVIGYVNGDDARAYPVRILDRHELVNDTVGGKPVTVGW